MTDTASGAVNGVKKRTARGRRGRSQFFPVPVHARMSTAAAAAACAVSERNAAGLIEARSSALAAGRLGSTKAHATAV